MFIVYCSIVYEHTVFFFLIFLILKISNQKILYLDKFTEIKFIRFDKFWEWVNNNNYNYYRNTFLIFVFLRKTVRIYFKPQIKSNLIIMICKCSTLKAHLIWLFNLAILKLKQKKLLFETLLLFKTNLKSNFINKNKERGIISRPSKWISRSMCRLYLQ